MAEKRKRIMWKKATAGILAAALVSGLAAGIWIGSKGDGEVSPAISKKDTDIVTTEPQIPGEELMTQEERQEQADVQERKETQEKQTEEQTRDASGASAQKENVSDVQREIDSSGSGQEFSGNTQESAPAGSGNSGRQEQYEVGDIMEDGSMYTGGDVEAGLDYIRENPQIWDQIVWH